MDKDFSNMSEEEMLKAGAMLYNGSIDSAHQIMKEINGKVRNTEAWEVLTSDGAQLVVSSDHDIKIMNPGTWFILEGGSFKIVRNAGGGILKKNPGVGTNE